MLYAKKIFSTVLASLFVFAPICLADNHRKTDNSRKAELKLTNDFVISFSLNDKYIKCTVTMLNLTDCERKKLSESASLFSREFENIIKKKINRYWYIDRQIKKDEFVFSVFDGRINHILVKFLRNIFSLYFRFFEQNTDKSKDRSVIDNYCGLIFDLIGKNAIEENPIEKRNRKVDINPELRDKYLGFEDFTLESGSKTALTSKEVKDIIGENSNDDEEEFEAMTGTDI